MMYCTRKVTENLIWVGANDRRLAMFEGVYSVPGGVSYNAYLLTDEKTVLFDTVDKSVRTRFMENVRKTLGSRNLDYFIIQHMEPDHSAGINDILQAYPDACLVCNEKTLGFIKQFFEFDFDINKRVKVVKEGDELDTGSHKLKFIMAPMVHWPEVMMTYDAAGKILFSADAFGCFGALNGALFADEVDFGRDYMDEARRYYTNIVGKYGDQVQSVLSKAETLDIGMICPLHGFVWRKNLHEIIGKYNIWSSYEPEEYGVMIAYASVYGNTENTAEILGCRLREQGVKTVMYDVSVTPASDIVSAAFRWSHLVFASTTYNAGIFVTMESVIYDLVSHKLQNRTVAVIENGSWAAASGGLIRELLGKCGNMRFLDDMISLKSSLKENQLPEIDAMCEAIAQTLPEQFKSPVSAMAPAGQAEVQAAKQVSTGAIDNNAFFKLTYGLFVLTAKGADGKDNGCIINTAAQVTVEPNRISVTVNKANYTHDQIAAGGVFNLSILSESASFDVFKQFGFQSGRDTDKFDGMPDIRAANGVRYLNENVSGVISGKVSSSVDCGTHTLFLADVTEAFVLSGTPSVTYQYYFDHIKPKPQVPKEKKKGFACKICGFIYEGDSLPDDYICPLCKHPASDFEPL